MWRFEEIPGMIYLISAMVAGSAFVLAYGSLALATQKLGDHRSELEAVRGQGAEVWARAILALTTKALAPWHQRRFFKKYREQLRRDNLASGVPWDLNEDEILTLSELFLVAGAVLVWIFVAFVFGALNPLGALLMGILAGLAPGYLLGQNAVTRRIQINRKLPFALDLLVLGMEAGGGFLESIEKVVASDPSSPISEEFRQMLQEIQFGKSRQEALLNLSERVRSEDLTPVVYAINTGESLGTPIGRILRVQAEGIRGRRSQRAEKLAAEASSKILFPTLLIMMAVLLMLMGPVIIKAVRGDWS